MYHILFVDDDPLILRRLHQVLDWDSLGFEILPDATDGETALLRIASQVPDVMICDINMPNMDGLTLAEKVRKENPRVQCIILTVNDSFGCAQQALNLGVCHYLLKPVEPEKLKSLMHTILERLDTSRREDSYVSGLYSQAMITEKMIRDKFLNWVVSGRQPLTEQQLIEKFLFYQLPARAREFEILSIHINAFEERLLGQERIEDLLGAVTGCVEDTLCDYPDCVVFTDSFYRLNVLVGTDPQTAGPAGNVRLICQSLRDSLLFNLNLPVTIFYSRRYQGFQNIYRCYFDTKFLSHYTQDIMDMGIISFDDYVNAFRTKAVDLDGIRSFVLRGLRSCNEAELNSYIRELLSEYSAAGFESFNMIRIDLVMTGIMFLQENRTNLTDIFGKYYNPLTEVMEKDLPEECIVFICDFYQRIIHFIPSLKVSAGRRLAEKCVELIEQNLSNPELNVKWLASRLYVNDNYLSRQFHKELGTPLIRYINLKKLEAAKSCLDQGYTNLTQVAEMTGFTDPLYFSKCFKKQFGVSPSRYR